MAPVEGTPGVFAVVVHLPPGYHQYKFIVDGKWMHDETAPYMPDPLGNVNNWLFVRKIDPPAPQQPAGMGFDPAQQVAQQQQQQQQQQPALQQQQQSVQVQLQQQQQQLQQQAAAAAAAAVVQQAAAAVRTPSGLTAALQHPSQAHLASGQQQQQQQQPQQQQQQQQPPQHPSAPPIIPTTGPLLVGSAGGGDVDMAAADPVVAPILARGEGEPGLTRQKVADFLSSHTAYELIPESGKVVLLDADLPVRQGFHALHEQGAASAPLWDGAEGTISGVLSASDFIHLLRRLRNAVSSGSNPLSEQEMDAHTIRGMREAASAEGRHPKPLVYVKPQDPLSQVVRTLYDHRCSMAPILSCDTGGLEVPELLHIATLGGVLGCLMRHFRASLASLPLLSQPLGALPLGTWVADAPAPPDAVSMTAPTANGNGQSAGHQQHRGAKKVPALTTVQLGTPLTTALGLLLEAGVSALPVVDERGVLLDIYARADITLLCKGNAYNRLQWEDVTVGQALSLAQANPSAWAQHSSGAALQGLSAELAAQQAGMRGLEGQVRGGQPGQPSSRVCVVCRDDTLRTCVERLATPGVRRLVVVARDTRRVEGIISLSDMAGFLFPVSRDS